MTREELFITYMTQNRGYSRETIMEWLKSARERYPHIDKFLNEECKDTSFSALLRAANLCIGPDENNN